MTTQTFIGDRAGYNKALQAYKDKTKAEMSAYLTSVSGSGVFTFELWYKYEQLLDFGLILPLPWQLGYLNNARNKDIFIHNINTFFNAVEINDFNDADPKAYEVPYDPDLGDPPVYIKKKSDDLFGKILKGVVGIAAAIVVGPVVIGAIAKAAVGAYYIVGTKLAAAGAALVEFGKEAATSAIKNTAKAKIAETIKGKTAAPVTGGTAPVQPVSDAELEALQAQIDASKAATSAAKNQAGSGGSAAAIGWIAAAIAALKFIF